MSQNLEESKFQVLKTLYSQQQSTALILRDRMSKITTGVIGLLAIIDGWLLTEEAIRTRSQLLVILISISVIILVALYALSARYKEFAAVARLIVRIETAMKLYEKDVYLPAQTLYPPEYQNLGKENYEHGKNIFLSQAYILIVFGLLSAGIALFS